MKDDKFDDAVSHARAKLALFLGAAQGIEMRMEGNIDPDRLMLACDLPDGRTIDVSYRELTLIAGSDLYYLPEEPKP